MSDLSSPRPTATAEDVDRMIQERQKQRSKRACYPCARRKVKCDQRQPCKICVERGYPDLCSYDLRSNHGARLRHSRTSHGSTSGGSERPLRRPRGLSPAVADETRPIFPEHRSISRNVEAATERETTFMGDNAVPSVIGSRSGQGATNTDIPMILGLQNSLLYYPFMEPLSADEIKRELYKYLPSYQEVKEYFFLYRSMAYPFNPIVTAIDEFEAYICTYLELAFNWDPETTPEKLIMKHQGPYQAAGQISLLLATLASGVLYSDLAVGPRRDLCHRFSRESFQCLRLANFILSPSEESLQSLLIMGNILQCVGQSDGAYALLGTTVRLAESLGCHSDQRLSRLPHDKKQKRQRLWFSTVWSDCLLSLCYDRPPATTLYRRSLSSTFSEAGLFGYTEAMYKLCDISLASFMIDKDPGSIPARMSLLEELDKVYSQCKIHLRKRQVCFTDHQQTEHFAFLLHSSHFASTVCRPAFRRRANSNEERSYSELMREGISYLKKTLEAFLDFQAISIIPTRSWSMTHAALTAALLLRALGEPERDPAVLEAQHGLITALTKGYNRNSGPESNFIESCAWLSGSHIRALKALIGFVGHDTLNRETVTDQRVPEGRPDTDYFSDPTFIELARSLDVPIQQMRPPVEASTLASGGNVQSSLTPNFITDIDWSSPMGFVDDVLWGDIFADPYQFSTDVPWPGN